MDAVAQPRDILLAEDNPADVNLLRTAFREYGRLPWRIYSVRDGEAALAFLQQQGVYVGMPRPQLTILDIGLPKLGGWKVLQAIRATPALATVPIVMLTGARMEVDDAHRAVLQPVGYFVKPLLLREYQQLVGELEQLLRTIAGKR
jgi:two-component system, chemotaxis family, response regulator Rcp1